MLDGITASFINAFFVRLLTLNALRDAHPAHIPSTSAANSCVLSWHAAASSHVAGLSGDALLQPSGVS